MSYLLFFHIYINSDNLLLCRSGAWGLHALSDRNEELYENMLAKQTHKRLISLLAQEHCSILLPCLCTLGNIIANGSSYQTLVLLENNLIELLKDLIETENLLIRKESLWILSNIASDPHHSRTLYD